MREFITALVLNGQVTAEVSGLRPVDLYVLNLLDIDGRSTPGELAQRTALTTGAVTKLVDRLVRLGLVQRTHDTDDRRRVWLTTTEQATRNIGEGASLFSPIARRMDDLISSYSDEHRAVIFDFLLRATEELKEITSALQEQRTGQRARIRGGAH
ncbi:MarR family winged helix-turn-helix transcriptional regulator [Streptomonospora sp. PA3]|uniref:MarR family winged helix-turn-helix transcriptional regulator n=1 Tax=Streptomonospora sp. PA3 TaxID=2607326 RepID=UPI001642C2DF|nr:MarR family transcriptional regulator [Streptomonospora sp. PA3]